jgi:hypothetical protein
LLLLSLSSFAEHSAAIIRAPSLFFQRFPDGEPVALFSHVVDQNKENDIW